MTNYLELLRWHNKIDCPYPKCKKKFEDGIVKTKVENGNLVGWYPAGSFLFHYYDTHGFPPELMVEEFEKLINSEMHQEEINIYNQIMRTGKNVTGINGFF